MGWKFKVTYVGSHMEQVVADLLKEEKAFIISYFYPSLLSFVDTTVLLRLSLPTSTEDCSGANRTKHNSILKKDVSCDYSSVLSSKVYSKTMRDDKHLLDALSFVQSFQFDNVDVAWLSQWVSHTKKKMV